uniref:Str_synth domain-containing protein n=1 Tax=Strongyloides papillosus TaxID=174720 RepID=A0A0N5BCW7_STREA
MSKKTRSYNTKDIKKPSAKELFSKLRLTRRAVIQSITFSLILSLSISFFFNLGPTNPQSYRQVLKHKISKKIEIKNLECKNRIVSDYIKGPESLLYNKERNSIFSGSRNGSIVELDIDTLKIKKVYSIFNNNKKINCDGSSYTLPKCGRPLGIHFGVTSTTRNTLYVADGIFGIYSLDLNSQKITVIEDSREREGNNKKMYGNDLVVTKTGIYFSISSTKFDDHEYLYDVLEHSNNGKIMFYDFETKRISEIMKDLYFPNGIQFIENKEILLVGEMTKMRIIKIDLKKEKAVSEKFIEYLPGYVDNIRVIQKDNVKQLIVPIPEQVTDNDEIFANYSGLRRMLTSIFQYPIIEKIISFLSNDNSIFQYYDIDTGEYLETYSVPFKGLSISHVLHLQNLNTFYFGSDNGNHIYACQLSS